MRCRVESTDRLFWILTFCLKEMCGELVSWQAGRLRASQRDCAPWCQVVREIMYGSSFVNQVKVCKGGGCWEQLVKLMCLSVHRCVCVEKKKQLDATEWFIALIICPKCFGRFYAHHQELETICVLLPPMACVALFAGCWSQVQSSGL